MTENAIAKEIVDAAFRIHTTLGPGLLESVYHAVLAYELTQRGLQTVSQQAIPVIYGTIRIDIGFRADLIVEDRVIVEIKSVEALARRFTKNSFSPTYGWPINGLACRSTSTRPLWRTASPVSSMDWKKSLTQSRKDGKNTSEAAGFGILSV